RSVMRRNPVTTNALWKLGAIALGAIASLSAPALAQEKRPNIVMLMTDDTGWNDFGAYTGGGQALGHPTPEHRQGRRRRRLVHQLVRSGELHRGPRFVHDRAHPHPLGALGRRRSGRRELPPQGDADHRRIL